MDVLLMLIAWVIAIGLIIAFFMGATRDRQDDER